MILCAFAAAVQQYHAAASTAVPVVSTWTQGLPEMSARPGVVGGFSSPVGSAEHGGGLFTVSLPYSGQDAYTLSLHLVNADEIARSYRSFNLCVAALPASQGPAADAGDGGQFLAAAAATGACNVLNPSKGSVAMPVSVTDGTPVSARSERSGQGAAPRPQIYAFDVGVSGGSYFLVPGQAPVSPRFLLEVD